MSKAAIVVIAIACASSIVSEIFSLLTLFRLEDSDRYFRGVLRAYRTDQGGAEVKPTIPPARVGSFSTVEEAMEYEKRNFAAVNGCLKAIEAAGLTSAEAQSIPEQLEQAVAFENVQQLHVAAFKAFEISREPDGLGGWENKPKGFRAFMAWSRNKRNKKG
nr:MAG TPA: hypothetical protein [Bacteriophage sp.]